MFFVLSVILVIPKHDSTSPSSICQFGEAEVELFEEVGLIAKEGDLWEAGLCHFFFGGKPFMDVWIFSTEKFSGEPVETEEATPVWFDLKSVPFDKMWQDDSFWFPLMLEKRKFEGSFWFDESNKILLKPSIKEI